MVKVPPLGHVIGMETHTHTKGIELRIFFCIELRIFVSLNYTVSGWFSFVGCLRGRYRHIRTRMNLLSVCVSFCASLPHDRFIALVGILLGIWWKAMWPNHRVSMFSVYLA